LLPHLGGENFEAVKAVDSAPAIEPDLNADVDTIRFGFIGRRGPAYLVNVICKAGAFLVMNDPKSTGILVKVIDDEQVAPPLTGPNGEETGFT